MTKNKKSWFQKLFSQCILPRDNYFSHQVGYDHGIELTQFKETTQILICID